MAAIEANILSDDNTHFKATCLLNSIRDILASSKMFGKDFNSVSSWSSWMTKARFVNIKEKVYKVNDWLMSIGETELIASKLPQGPWSTEPDLQELGRYQQLHMIEALPSWTYALFTRVLGRQRLEIEAQLAGARCELKDPSLNMYTRVYIIHGQKPSLVRRASFQNRRDNKYKRRNQPFYHVPQPWMLICDPSIRKPMQETSSVRIHCYPQAAHLHESPGLAEITHFLLSTHRRHSLEVAYNHSRKYVHNTSDELLLHSRASWMLKFINTCALLALSAVEKIRKCHSW